MARIRPQDQMDQKSHRDLHMHELWHRVIISAVQLWQAPSPWSSSFPSKWHSTDKSRHSFLKKA